VTVGGIGAFEAEVLGFDALHIVVAPDREVASAVGRSALVTLGVGEQHESGLVAIVRSKTTTADGRECLVMELAESGSQRALLQLPFAAKVDMMLVSGRIRSDQPLRGVAVELSQRNIAVRAERDLPAHTLALLRFAVPPNRGATVQVRAKVISCQPDPDGGFVHNFSFERVTGTVAQQLAGALRALATGE
jgi:hypothetical protein